MNLSTFVSQLPKDLVLAPIYRKGETMRSGKIAVGKNPVEAAHERKLGPADAALICERSSKVGAIGLFTGQKGNGIVILDVDKNLGALAMKWGDSLDGAPKITSTRKNAAKFVFRIPEALWGEVKGWHHGEDHAEGYEVLWGPQGLIQGEYPGGRNSEPGEYSLEGDLSAIPDAPEWLIAEMKAAKVPEGGGFVKNKKALDVSDRTPEEIATIIEECLTVITHRGAGSRDHWIRVGMAIHAVLPTDEGLTLWSMWSAQDPEFGHEWEDGNPCEQPWKSFKPGGRIGLGSLIWEADQADPTRSRFCESSKSILTDAEKAPTRYRLERLGFDEVIKRGKQALELDDTARMNFELHQLALEAGYRDQSALEKLLIEQMSQEKNGDQYTLEQLRDNAKPRNYIIPDVLPHPAVVLVYGSGGDGKSMSCWTIAKHIAAGIPFMVRGQLVPVDQGPVLILNGDQSPDILAEQLGEIDMPSKNVHIINNWNMQRCSQFQRIVERIKPKLIIIDSLIGCSGGRAFDENKSDFATPLYWLSRNNGSELLYGTTIMVIHHANKTGGFRGTTAIRDAVDETWALRKPTEKDGVPQHCRIITIEKSRSGRSGTSLIMRQEKDLTFSIADFTPEIDPANTSPGSITDRVLQRLRAIYPRSISRAELVADELVGGNVAAIKKSLQRLVKRQLIVPAEGKHTFQAVLSRGEGENSVPINENVGSDCEVDRDTASNVSRGVPKSQKSGHTPLEADECPDPDVSAGASSGQSGQPGQYPRASDFTKWD